MFDPHRTMQRIKNNDFNAVEVAGTWGQSKKTFSKMLQEHELSVAGCHIAPPPFDMINSSSEDRGAILQILDRRSRVIQLSAPSSDERPTSPHKRYTESSPVTSVLRQNL